MRTVDPPAPERSGSSGQGTLALVRATLRWRIGYVVGFCLVTTFLTFLFTAHEAKVYTASVSVVVQSSPLTSSASGPNMASESAIAGSPAVAAIVARTTHSSLGPRRLLSGLNVTNPIESQVLQFTYDSSDPARARQLASAFAHAYLQFRHNLLQQQAQDAEATIQAKITSLSKQLTTLRSDATSVTGKQQQVLLSDAAAVSNQIGTLTAQLGTLNTAGAFAGGQLGAAQSSAGPVRPKGTLNLLAGAVAGALLGLVVGAFRERREGLLRSAEEVEELLQAPVFASLAVAEPTDASGGTLSIDDPVMAAQLARLRERVLQGANGSKGRALLVMGGGGAPSTELVARSLAASIAATRTRVVLVSADLGAPLMEGYGVPAAPTLADVLLDAATVPEAMTLAPTPNLWLVEGQARSDEAGASRGLLAAQALDSRRARWIVRQIATAYDAIVCVVAPNRDALSDAYIWSTACNSVVVVADRGSTTRPQLAGTRDELLGADASVAGAVFVTSNGAHPRGWFSRARLSEWGRGVSRRRVTRGARASGEQQAEEGGLT